MPQPETIKFKGIEIILDEILPEEFIALRTKHGLCVLDCRDRIIMRIEIPQFKDIKLFTERTITFRDWPGAYKDAPKR